VNRGRAIAAAGLTGVAAVAVLVLLRGGFASGDSAAGSAAESFLSRYVEPEGRVVRIDQGGDTVSEGQAYAMLLAAAEGDAGTFARVWRWTRANLEQPNGLLAWHWEDGHVTDPSSAADADLDAAWALLIASRRFDQGGYRVAALRLGAAILDHETVGIEGRAVLVAGDWAQSVPAQVDPSYFTPAAFVALGRASGDPRWGQLSSTGREILAQLTDRPSGLPPDWAAVEADGRARATAPPGEEGEAVFGYDAVRVPLWQAGSCEAPDRGLGARSAPFLAEALAGSPAAVYNLDGEPRGGPAGAPTFVAAAAASAAAGDEAEAQESLARAEAADEAAATYYGEALVALARVSLPPEGVLGC
jgi:endoglucanase